MKVYISGKITGVPIDEARATFAKVEEQLNAGFNFECVNPMNNGLPETATWREHMARDVSLLMQCDAVYMIEGWETSRGASIEHYIASNAGMPIMYQATAYTGVMVDVALALQLATTEERDAIIEVTEALYRVTGATMAEFCGDTRRREMVYARMVFVYQCRKKAVRIRILARCIRRNKSAIRRIVQQYTADHKFNKQFRRMADDVAEILKRKQKTNNEKD